jgi:ribonuclease R
MNKDNYIPRNELRKYILDIVKNDKYNSVPAGIILKKIIEIDQYYSAHKQIVYDYIFSLIDDGELFQQNDSGKISINKQHYTFKGSEREGIIAINSAGNGFITVDDTKYFIYRTNTKNAQNGDLVSFHEISRAEKDNEAIVTKIINHEKKCYVCWVNEAKNLVPDDIRCNLEFKLTDNSKVTPNEKILIKVTEYKDNVAFCSLISVIGNKDDIGVDVLSIVLDANIEPDFDSELLKEAEAKTIEVDEKQKSLRKDLTHLNIITIDPATSKDFDDAYYLETTKTGYKLYVCIADVSHFVQLNSDLGIEALKRTSSIYLIDRVIPMLPHALSNGICSINPNEIRFSLTCEMDLNKEGVITNTKLYPSIIKSKRRFSYDEVNDFFNNKNELKNDTKEIKDMLLLSKQLHIILRELKIRLGYINLSSNEPNIIVNNQNKIIDIVKKPSGTAQEMIEDFMVCANESVTKYAVEKKYPFIYRIHETPVEEKIKDFILEAKSISFLTPEVSFPITSKILSK